MQTLSQLSKQEYQSWLDEAKLVNIPVPPVLLSKTNQPPMLNDFTDVLVGTLTEALYSGGNPKKPSVLVYGPAGTGKTHLAYALVRDIYNRKISSLEKAELLGLPRQFPPKPPSVFNAVELIESAKRDMDLPFESRADTVQLILDQDPVLILDDISEVSSTWAINLLYRIINHRYENLLQTVYTSNHDSKTLERVLGDRIASRLLGSTVPVSLGSNDRRIA